MENVYTIFLASSLSLGEERKAVEIEVGRWNHEMREEGRRVVFKLVTSDHFDEAMVADGKQNEYDLKIKNCHIFILLYWERVGIFTNHEFDVAHQAFLHCDGTHPMRFIYKCNRAMPASATDADKETVKLFEEKYRYDTDKLHYNGNYTTTADLIAGIKTQRDHLFTKGYLKKGTRILTTEQLAPPALFLGREDDMAEITQRLKDNKRLMLINAEGGIGKTSLAANYWEKAYNVYDNKAWLFCDAGILGAMKKLAPALGIDLSNLNEEQELEPSKEA